MKKGQGNGKRGVVGGEGAERLNVLYLDCSGGYTDV